MFRSLKCFELTMHKAFSKIKRISKDTNNQNENYFEKLTGIVFSSAMSLFLSYLSKTYFGNSNNNDICNVILSFVFAIVVYIIFYILIKYLYTFVTRSFRKKIDNTKIHRADQSIDKAKELINDFDHIVIDNLLISYEFLEEIKKSKNIKISTFYYHEIIYYLKKSVDITLELTDEIREEQCININNNVQGIELFRLHNVIDMMKDIMKKVNGR